MTQLENKLVTQRNYVSQFLEQLMVDYQNAKSEWRDIAEHYPGSEAEFAPLEEIELLTVSIRGYANQIKATGSIKNRQQAIAQLQHLRMLDHPTVAQFSVETEMLYPLIHSYIQKLDYLRLLVLEYLQMQQSIQPISIH